MLRRFRASPSASDAFQKHAVIRRRGTAGALSGVATLLVAPEIGADLLTTRMKSWLEELARTLPETDTLFGTAASRTNVKKWFQRNRGRRVLFVFYGHGTSDALLTHVSLGGDSKKYDNKFSCLSTAGDLEGCADLQAIAFCCSAATWFLPQLVASRSATGIGFTNQIGFVFGTDDRERAFSQPMGNAVQKAYNTRTIDDLSLTELKEAYRAERGRWMANGALAKDTRSLIVATLLHGHLRALKHI